MHRRTSGVIAAGVAAAALVAALTGSPSSDLAAQGQSSANMLVSANVVRKCILTANPLNFGNYDPVQANSTTPLDGQTTISVSCTKGTAVTIAMDDGGNFLAARRMAGAASSFLMYELYKDASRTQRWGSNPTEVYNGGVAPSHDPRSFIVYGRVTAAQDVPEGAFQDTILVTVQF